MADTLKTVADALALAGSAVDIGTKVAGVVASTNREQRLARAAARLRRRDQLRAARMRARAARLRGLAETLKPRAQRRRARLLSRALRNDAAAAVLAGGR